MRAPACGWQMKEDHKAYDFSLFPCFQNVLLFAHPDAEVGYE
jgi:hypothetical protein